MPLICPIGKSGGGAGGMLARCGGERYVRDGDKNTDSGLVVLYFAASGGDVGAISGGSGPLYDTDRFGVAGCKPDH